MGGEVGRDDVLGIRNWCDTLIVMVLGVHAVLELNLKFPIDDGPVITTNRPARVVPPPLAARG